MYAWKLDEDRVEFNRVKPAELLADPGGFYVIQQSDGMLVLRANGTDQLIKNERLLLCGVEFDREEFDPVLDIRHPYLCA